jgi:hypothetical protein
MRISVSFPGEPERFDVPIGTGQMAIMTTIVRCTKDGARYTLIRNTPIPDAAKKNPARSFEMAKEQALLNPGFILVKDEAITLGLLEGRRQVFKVQGKTRIEQRLFIIGDSLYTVGVGATWSVDLDTVSKKFFESVKKQ